jgi:hypothetical protein
MASDCSIDEAVESEINRLRKSPLVALACKEQLIRRRRQQILLKLRALENRGIELSQKGVTMEFLDLMEASDNLERELVNHGK